MIFDPKIKLLQLRKIKLKTSLFINVEGPLLSKGAHRSKFQTNSVNKQIQKATQLYHWRPPPRARIAVSFKIFSDQHNPPEIYRVIKYYLDLLKGPVFNDDRQVQYLDASIWRSTPEGKNGPSNLFIRVRRLREYLQMIELCEESDKFYHRDDKHIVFHHLLFDKSLRNKAKKQCDFLSGSTIMQYDMPRLKNPTLKSMAQDFNSIYPLVFDFGSLPKRGQSQYFKKVIASSFSDFVTNYPIFRQMLVPIEFDVQVTKTRLNLTKDLDNIMISICSEARNQFLSPNSYVNGYRVYVVDKLESNIESGIQVKLLTPGEIESFNDRIEKALEKLEENLEDTI